MPATLALLTCHQVSYLVAPPARAKDAPLGVFGPFFVLVFLLHPWHFSR